MPITITQLFSCNNCVGVTPCWPPPDLKTPPGATLVRVSGEAEKHDGDKRTTLVIADDHAVVRSGLRMLLDAEPDLDVVAEAGDVDSARRYVRGHKPAVLILDLNMPGEPSLPAIPKLRDEFPNTQIVVLTMQDDPAF